MVIVAGHIVVDPKEPDWYLAPRYFPLRWRSTTSRMCAP